MSQLIFLSALLLSITAQAKTVHYELSIAPQKINLSGKKDVEFALAVNQQIPAPTLEFTEGDEAEIVLTNRVPDQEVSVHWHGLLLPPGMDGVAYVNTPPIHPGESFTYKFKLRQSGTYWYHSHTGLQEQKGVFGAFIVHPQKKSFAYDRDAVAVLSDWTDENPDQVLKNLRKDGDYYLYKKNTVRSWWGAIRFGGFWPFIKNQWQRMGGMDLSDVGYDAFLINGKKNAPLITGRPGERVRVRVINASASTYFYLSLGGAPMHVISADGVDIEPQMANEILMGMAETYDILVTIPDQRSLELRATAQDISGFASAWIGEGEKVAVADKPPVDLYAPMDHGSHHAGAHDSQAHASHNAHHEHGAAAVALLQVDQLKASKPTEYSGAVHELKLVLGGDMNRYIWHINGQVISQDRYIEVRAGDVFRFKIVNKTMMHHPMHLHGHFFRVLNSSGAYSPLKHTVDVSPHSERTIEFKAEEPGQWMFHCHNLYHMKSGMARIVKYSSFTPDTELEAQDPHRHDHIYSTGMLEVASNHAQGRLKLSRTWDTLEGRVESREEDHGRWSFEGDLLYRRWLGNYLSLTAGGYSFDGLQRGAAGVTYILPFMIDMTALIDHTGRTRVEIEKRFQWTSHLWSAIAMNFLERQKTEYELSLMYSSRWDWALGLMLTEQSLGGGIEYRF